MLVKKIDNPNQDIRYHKVELKNGFSGRTYDTKFITPVLKKNQLPSMAESAYLTRSIEQPHPLNKNFPGKIRDTDAKKSFLEIIDIFQKDPSHCEDILNYLILEGKKIKNKNFIPVKKIKTKEKIFIDDLIQLLVSYLNTNFKLSGASKVPVICIYSIYQIFWVVFTFLSRFIGNKVLLFYHFEVDFCVLLSSFHCPHPAYVDLSNPQHSHMATLCVTEKK